MMNKVIYNKQEEILSIKLSDAPSVDSEIRDNVVIDYDPKGEITNIDIMSFDIKDFKEISHLKTQPVMVDKFSIVK